MNKEIENIKSDLRQRFIVCPMPIYWAELHKILVKNNKKNIKIENPLILGGWGSSDKDKSERFLYHLTIAQDLHILPLITNYLEALSEDSFLYSDELKSGNSIAEKGYWDFVSEDRETFQKAIFPAFKILEKIQTINKNITDEDKLYDLFLKNGFDFYNYQKVEKGKSPLVDLLVELGDIFDNQKELIGGAEDLEDFCFQIFYEKSSNKIG